MRARVYATLLLTAATAACASSRTEEGDTAAAAAAPPATAAAESDPTNQVTGTGLPAGWQSRFDRPNSVATEVKVAAQGNGHRVTSGPAAIYWTPQSQATGNYTLSATVQQLAQSSHPEAYGLVFGGKSLDAANQAYYYFLVRQNGQFTVKHRAGAEVHTLADWAANPAVKATDGSGASTNALQVAIGADSVRFSVNGTQVAAFAKTQMGDTDGLYGYRVNHNLDVQLGPITVAQR
jgi:hypothetical protein